MKILIAEDDNLVYDMYNRVLTAEGFETLRASNGAETIEKCKKEKLDIILLDIMMPGVDGLQALKTIKETESLKGTDVIIVTNLANDFVRAEALNLGAKGFFSKSDMKNEELLNFIKSLKG